MVESMKKGYSTNIYSYYYLYQDKGLVHVCVQVHNNLKKKTIFAYVDV